MGAAATAISSRRQRVGFPGGPGRGDDDVVGRCRGGVSRARTFGRWSCGPSSSRRSTSRRDGVCARSRWVRERCGACPQSDHPRPGSPSRPPGNLMQWTIQRPYGGFCDPRHSRDAARAGSDVKDPPHTHQSSLTLAAFRPWGSSARWCRTRGLPDSLTETPPRPETGGSDTAETGQRPPSPPQDSEPRRGVGYSSGAARAGCGSRSRRIRLAAYGARLESVLGSRPRGFESPILRRPTGPGP